MAEFQAQKDYKGVPEDDASSPAMDPNDSDSLRDRIKGQTTEHAEPPRLEDEGQSGG